MSNFQEIQSHASDDAERLYDVASGIYTFLIIGNWIILVIGGGLSIYSLRETGPILGIGVAVVTAIICISIYTVAVLSTHFAKVLVQIQISLSNSKVPPNTPGISSSVPANKNDLSQIAPSSEVAQNRCPSCKTPITGKKDYCPKCGRYLLA